VARCRRRQYSQHPTEQATLTAFIDVQGKALYWMACAWSDGFSGSVIDYGTEPDQKGGPTRLREISRRLQEAAPGTGMEGAIAAGLEQRMSVEEAERRREGISSRASLH